MIYSLFEHQNLSLFLKLKKQFRQKMIILSSFTRLMTFFLLLNIKIIWRIFGI